MASVSGLSKPHRIEARDRFVHAAMLAYSHAPEIAYTQESERWEGIARHLLSQKGEYPTHADCSSLMTWCLWNAIHAKYGVRDTVNGSHWRGGFTGTMLDHGKEVRHLANVQRGDLVIYGNGGTGKHVAGIVGRRKRDGKLMVISHGSQSGPHFLAYDYRSDIMCVRRYV